MYQRREFTNRSYQDKNRLDSNNDWREKRQNDDSRRQSGFSRRNDNRCEEEESTTMQIANANVGRVIGRGGSKIKEIESESGARVKIDKNNATSTTPVILSGSSEARKRAFDLIDNLMNESNTRRNNYSDRRDNRQRKDDYDSSNYSSNSQYNSDNYSYQNYSPSQHNSDVDDFEKREFTSEDISFANINWQDVFQKSEQSHLEKWASFPQIIKNFYIEDPEVANMSQEEVKQIREANNKIEVSYLRFSDEAPAPTDPLPNPITTFEQAFRHYPEIMNEIRKQKFTKPSPVQMQAWPVLLSGKDMIGIAQTGTGKTLAFLLPALIHIDNQKELRQKHFGPNALVLAPTRELALQIEQEISKYSYRGIKAVCLYGGGSKQEQVKVVNKGVQIVIATPGRLNDLINSGILDLKCITFLILDEADRMLDMGFEPQIRKVLYDIRPNRQTVMTSATWPQGVRRLAKSYTKNPVQINVGSLDLAAVHSVTQNVYIVDEEEKETVLLNFFDNMSQEDKVIVFFGKKTRVDDFASNLALKGIQIQSIHGGRDQLDREQALEDIKNGDVRILLATDVASRGIDIEDITHVFNYDFPRDIEEYVHRVGRTGRAGRSGESITLMTRRDWSHAKDLIKILEEAMQEVPSELYNMEQRFEAMKEKRAQEKRDFGFGGRSGGRQKYRAN